MRNAESEAIILEALREGLYPAHAAARAGCQPDTLEEWRKLGRKDPDGPYGEFSRACLRAKMDGEAALVSRLIHGDDISKIPWYLERLNPARFHLSQKTELSGPAGGPVKIETDLAAKLAKSLDEEE